MGIMRHLNRGSNHDTTHSAARSSKAGDAGSIDQAALDKASKSLLARDA